ncbi:HET-domain-containing protein [Decorospora gaudefroyi]|uniref:HET-domain-containing protein n=1 Tax=Decorospora gaudefroyi TaxID=184978 RepID=A0A6A5KKL3_9PLEO|nr:HET-domain-containing protein [Decorospora gaudefroyi]
MPSGERDELIRRAEAEWDFVLQKLRCRPDNTGNGGHRNELCSRCASIDWAQLATLELPHDNILDSGVIFDIRESSEELCSSSCRVCQMLGRGKLFQTDEEDDDGEALPLWIRCMCHLTNSESLSDMNDMNCMSRGNTERQHGPLLYFRGGHRFRFGLLPAKGHRGILSPRRLEPSAIDYDAIRYWFAFCENTHANFCKPVYEQYIPGFKVIDCQTKRVVDAPQSPLFRYVALSYVWGIPSNIPQDQCQFPRTVQDAIVVTLELGYQYLWVDQFCIDQHNETEKTIQIRMMDRIYSQSQLVIIAAAGQSADHGLPGVGTTSRTAQLRAETVNGEELIQIFHPFADLYRSKWTSRAWTYQEGFLSIRRLVFTEHEAFFVCNKMSCQESVDLQLHSRPGNQPEGLRWHGPLHLPGTCHHDGRKSADGRLHDVASFLQNYCMKKISYESDILNGCVGILNTLVDGHYWGMPMEYLAHGDYYMDLYWRCPRPGKRREGFPSWTWAATTRRAWLSMTRGAWTGLYTVRIPSADGSWQTVDELIKSGTAASSSLSGATLCVTGQLFSVRVVGRRLIHMDELTIRERVMSERSHIPDHHVIFSYSDHVEMGLELELDVETPGATYTGDFQAILLGDITVTQLHGFDRLSPPWRAPVFLLLEPVGTHYRRIGVTNNVCRTMSKTTGRLHIPRSGDRKPELSGLEDTVYLV